MIPKKFLSRVGQERHGGAGNEEIIGIQYLRGIAAIVVVFDHTSVIAAFEKYFGRTCLNGLLSSGARGVDLFFLISGFIICAVSLAEDGATPKIDQRSFFERRFNRIVPMMWLAIVSYAILRGVGRADFYSHATNYLRAIFLIPYGQVEPNQIWTLRHEAIFYFLFAISYLSGKKRVWILALWAASPFAHAALTEGQSDDAQTFLDVICSPVNIEFTMGYLIGLIWHRRTKKWTFSVPIHPLYLMTVACVAVMSLNYFLPSSFSDLFIRMCFALCFAPILFFGVHVACPTGTADRIGRLFGDASYVIYLFHPHFVSAVLGVWARYAYQTPVGFVIFGTSVLATGAGVVIHIYLERRVVRAAKRITAYCFGPSPAS
jgi:exopolysaccharide production protein ExoZ